MNRTTLLLLPACALLFSTSGCIGFSSVLGQTASPLGDNRAEVAVSPGAALTRTTTAGDADSTQTQINTGVPEGNVGYGLTDTIDVGLHTSAAGAEPYVKLNVYHEGGLSLAVMPNLAYSRLTRSTSQDGATFNLRTEGFHAGLDMLFSTDSGLYGGLGYQFRRVDLPSLDLDVGGGAPVQPEVEVHGLAAALGFEIDGGAFLLRPEISGIYGLAGTIGSSTTDFNTGQQTSTEEDFEVLHIFASVTIAVQSP